MTTIDQKIFAAEDSLARAKKKALEIGFQPWPNTTAKAAKIMELAKVTLSAYHHLDDLKARKRRGEV